MNGEYSEPQARGDIFTGTPSDVAAAHELKAPLALIRQLAFDIANDPGDPRVGAERILMTAERALRLTGDITKHARLEDSFFETEPLNAQMICEEVVDEIHPLYRANNRQIVVSDRRVSPLIVANRELLRRVLLGFADNALHHVDAETPVRVSVQANRKQHVVRLSVRDFGPAVQGESWRAGEVELGSRPSVLPIRPESSGLGIYLARQFAEAMRATIGVTRHRDGASFYIELPESMQMSLL